jgi:hypothetical protein
MLPLAKQAGAPASNTTSFVPPRHEVPWIPGFEDLYRVAGQASSPVVRMNDNV